MARRRKKNPLLMRIVVVTIVIHLIALPIAAHFGAFEKLKQKFGESRVTLVPLPKQTKEKEQAKEKKAKPKVAKSTGKSVVKKGGPAKADPNRQKVVAVNNPNDTSEGASIAQGTRTDAGVLPPVKKDTGPTKTSTGTGGGNEAPTNVKPIVTPPPPPPPVTEVKPVEIPKPKHVPVYAEPEQDYSPQPTIPDDLRNESFEKNFVALFTVGADGKPIDVKMTQSTGNSELDEIALKTAKQWRFKPATSDGSGITSKVKLTIEFKVE